VAAVSQITYQVRPGRMTDFLAAARELKAAIERLGVGVRSVRLFEMEVAGPHSGRVVLAFEYEDLASWGETVDRELALVDQESDAAWLALVERAHGAEAPAVVVERALLVERPL
jgi:hypothetical protein